MSYSKLLVEFASKQDLDISLIHPMDRIMLDDILEEIPHRDVIVGDLLFALDEICEVIKLTYDYHSLTGYHLGRVGRLGAYLSKRANLPWTVRLECLYGGWIHDIGKIHTPLDILNKPAKLTNEEYSTMKKHVQYGIDMLQFFPHLEIFSDPIRYHHEKYDGSGYPHGLSGQNIPLSGRVTAIVDAYDAMTSSRPYTCKKTHQEAADEIKRCAGQHFDPELVQAFLTISEGEIDALSLYS